METSQAVSGTHTVASSCGQFIASIANGKLRICAIHTPERFSEINIRIQPRDVTAVKWHDDSDRVIVSSNRLIEVVDLHDDNHRIRLDNGSGGLGKSATADFIGADQLLVTWEFGKAKVWHLSNGKSTDLSDIKTTCSGDKWQLRPKEMNASTRTQTLAALSRSGVEDVLQLFLPSLQKTIATTKLPTKDAQSLSWSPDGRWLAVMDSPTASTSVHFYTPDGHLFRSYPSSRSSSHLGLGVRAVHWASNSQIVGLARFDGKIVLLNCRTFTTLAVIEHNTVIDQTAAEPKQQATIWQELVSSSGERSHTAVSQPFSPPLSRKKSSTEPSELGVAEACFSAGGAYLATRDERMLNTVWIWDTSSLSALAVVVQHSNVRRMQWHPSRPDSLLLDSGEASAYVFNASDPHEPPVIFPLALPGTPALSWLPTSTNALPTILATTKSTFRLLFPEGRPEPDPSTNAKTTTSSETANAETEDDDSLLDMLAGRTPLPHQSYTERIDIEVETEEGDSPMRMEDTFRGKQVFGGGRIDGGGAVDPLDDSQIF